MRKIEKKDMDAALLGGCILGCGGGGSISWGKQLAEPAFAISDIALKSLDEFDDEDVIITVSGVGAPAAVDGYATEDNFVRAVELLQQSLAPQKIAGLITSENGGTSTANGWIQSVKLGIPVIDAPCNGRAHPSGIMGSLSLPDDYITYQSFSGGNPDKGLNIEGMTTGRMEPTSNLIRQSAVQAGGIVAVARNPVSVAYAKQHAAIGGISKAIELGHHFLENIEHSPSQSIEAVTKALKGDVIAQGEISNYLLTTSGGYDVGTLTVGDVELTIWNEYMTAEKSGQRIYTFPDLIMTFDQDTGYPITSAELSQGRNVVIIAARSEHLPLGSPMKDPKVLALIEPVIGKKIV